MEIMKYILFLVIILAFFEGNIMIIGAICGGYAIEWSEDWILVLTTVVVDIILLSKVIPSASSSFRLMMRGLKNRRITKRESARLKKHLKDEELDVDRLQELRDKRISESATKRIWHFCQLIESIAGKEQLQDCLSEVREKQSVLDEINDIENRILKVAESFKNVGDVYQCQYYLGILKSTKITPEITSLENECEEQLLRRERESRAIQLWKEVFLWILVILIVVFMVFYFKDTPYRELRSMIEDQSLTTEMCSRSNRNSEESYYDYLMSKKGYKFLVSELTKLHGDDDVRKAMWLLCIQPNDINGFQLGASPSFINWIVDYAKQNGIRSTYGTLYRVTYLVDDYEITLSSDYDQMSAITEGGFDISDGNNERSVRTKKSYVEETIPIIK